MDKIIGTPFQPGNAYGKGAPIKPAELKWLQRTVGTHFKTVIHKLWLATDDQIEKVLNDPREDQGTKMIAMAYKFASGGSIKHAELILNRVIGPIKESAPKDDNQDEPKISAKELLEALAIIKQMRENKTSPNEQEVKEWKSQEMSSQELLASSEASLAAESPTES